MSTTPRDLILYGAGGIGREIVSMAESGCHAGRGTPPWRIVGFVDDSPGMRGQSIHGVPCLGNIVEVAEQRKGTPTFCHISIGDNIARREAAERIGAAGWEAATRFLLLRTCSATSICIEIGLAAPILFDPFQTLGAPKILGSFLGFAPAAPRYIFFRRSIVLFVVRLDECSIILVIGIYRSAHRCERGLVRAWIVGVDRKRNVPSVGQPLFLILARGCQTHLHDRDKIAKPRKVADTEPSFAERVDRDA